MIASSGEDNATIVVKKDLAKRILKIIIENNSTLGVCLKH